MTSSREKNKEHQYIHKLEEMNNKINELLNGQLDLEEDYQLSDDDALSQLISPDRPSHRKTHSRQKSVVLFNCHEQPSFVRHSVAQEIRDELSK